MPRAAENGKASVEFRRPIRAISRFLSGLLDRARPSPTTTLLITAIVVGCLTGLAAILFVYLIGWITDLSFSELPELLPGLGRGWLIVIPVVGGLLGGPIIARFAPEAKGHGVPEVMQSLALNRGVIRPRVAIAKIVASSLCLGTGGSAGREGPIVQVGSTLGSMIGQLFRLSADRVRNLVACGAAAGVAATFNAPIAGVAFAIEVLSGELGLGVLSNVVISAVAASVVSQSLLGPGHAFDVPHYTLTNPLEILFYAGLGVFSAIIGVAFIRVLYFSEDRFDGWKSIPQWLKPAIGGLLLGGVAYVYPFLLQYRGLADDVTQAGLPVAENIPHIFGSGFAAIEAALSGPLPWELLGALVILKMLATSLTLGSGNSGGVFAPSLFMGAMLGGLFGLGIDALFPAMQLQPGAYALAGMAAVFSAAARAPLTAILIAFEMSNDYAMILPLMATTITATVVAARFHPESIYTLKLVRRGIRLTMGRDIDVMDGVRVGDIMSRDPPTVSASMLLGDVERFFISSHRHGVMVIDDANRLVGVLTLQDLAHAKQHEDWEELPAREVMIRTLLTAHPDDTMGDALQRIAVRDIGRLPVVDANDPTRLLGIIRRQDIVRAYHRGLIGRQELRDRAVQQRVAGAGITELVELHVRADSTAAGKRVRDLHLPEGVLLTTRRRGAGQQLLHGRDTLEVGDVVRALAEPQSVEALKGLFELPG